MAAFLPGIVDEAAKEESGALDQLLLGTEPAGGALIQTDPELAASRFRQSFTFTPEWLCSRERVLAQLLRCRRSR